MESLKPSLPMSIEHHAMTRPSNDSDYELLGVPEPLQKYLGPRVSHPYFERVKVTSAESDSNLLNPKYSRVCPYIAPSPVCERPLVCTVCGEAFIFQKDLALHEEVHSTELKFVCTGVTKQGRPWGCGRRFAGVEALGGHFRSEPCRILIQPLAAEATTTNSAIEEALVASRILTVRRSVPYYSLNSEVSGGGFLRMDMSLLKAIPGFSIHNDKVAVSAWEMVSDPRPISNTRHTEGISRIEGSDDVERSSKALSGESDCEDNENSEAETVSSEASSGSSFVSPIIEVYQRDMIESLMMEFKTLLDHSLRIRSRAASTGSSNSSPPRSSSDLPSTYSGSGKRKERDEDDLGSSKESGEEGGGDGSKRTRTDGPSPNQSPRKFACPYHRQNPQKHTKLRSCAGPGWESIHRVKEHVLRQHCIPAHCRRCYELFKTETDLMAHQRLPNPCEIKAAKVHEGCTKEQEKLLRKRNRGLGSDEDKWRDIFKCLFPDCSDDMIPTPYYDDEEIVAWESRRDSEFSRYEQYLARELPRVVRRELENAFKASARPLENELRSQLVDIVRDAQSTVFRSYRQTNMSGLSAALPLLDGVNIDQTQVYLFNDPELPPFFDISAYFMPPPVAADSFGLPVGTEYPASFPVDSAGTYQPTSDSGYESNHTSLNASHDRIGGSGSYSNGVFLDVSNGDNMPPSASHGSFQNLDSWLQ